MWFTVACGRSKEMLKSVCNQVVKRPNAGGWCVAAFAGGEETTPDSED